MEESKEIVFLGMKGEGKMNIELRLTRLQKPGYIPGSKAGKKEVVPGGTLVWVLMTDGRYYDCAFLEIKEACLCAGHLRDFAEKRGDQIVSEWNFRHYRPPLKVLRPKREKIYG